MNLYGAYGEYRDTFNVYAALSIYRKNAWPCWLCSSKLALWEDKDYVWIGAGVVEKQVRKRGLLALKMTTGTKCSCCLPEGRGYRGSHFGRTFGSHNNLTATLVACVSRRDALSSLTLLLLLAQVASVWVPVSPQHWCLYPHVIFISPQSKLRRTQPAWPRGFLVYGERCIDVKSIAIFSTSTI